ncbi:methyltransferase family protein [Ruminiclostridium cellulolyticum]|uniref:Isoprenylcysteine carboxyl methyltransferase n=1 Tax=Ruminiclostridium cellulolyticum (strain ATCC 35319 / DSM 5812 / JCM 6584 / H10) TaxID=394503 RepID=B8I0W7_RUMCH|nr:isoprenylcysteine carboxylmethyltransferase family protein [Ruminiclostridium cellulolyticum]ACL77523.1 Isoprenylcysteine carboxyl methyltransferase [Ruminiclostridium cellulolyticum H10]
MNITDAISLFMLIIFGASYILKLILLKQNSRIKANVLAKGDKEFSIFFTELSVRVSSSLWLLTWVSEIIFHNKISYFCGYIFKNIYITYAGIIITALGVVVFILATVFMKTSWRVGIDKSTKTALITNGIYKFSRNPAFVGFNLMFMGVFFTYSNVITLIILILNMLAFHLLILQEERHLLSVFGKEYERYKRNVPRYFIV